MTAIRNGSIIMNDIGGAPEGDAWVFVFGMLCVVAASAEGFAETRPWR